ncbi:hypothetical protein SNEBB_004541 [Seison nebaliae]|nr:hypothetical protein SNEBB_004541 [Seison nebaliae]
MKREKNDNPLGSGEDGGKHKESAKDASKDDLRRLRLIIPQMLMCKGDEKTVVEHTAIYFHSANVVLEAFNAKEEWNSICQKFMDDN